MRLYKLNKTVLSFKNNPFDFLNGLTSNALHQSRNAFLDIHGKIIATFDQLQISKDEFWIVVEKDFVPLVLKHLDRYARLSQVFIEERALNVFFDLEGDCPLLADDRVIVQKAGRFILTSGDLDARVTEEEFVLFRLKNDIPWLGIDYRDEMVLNVNETEFVSFTKGCFLGQEPVSKVHHRSHPTWKLVVKEESDPSIIRQPMTSCSFHPMTGSIVGFAFVRNKDG